MGSKWRKAKLALGLNSCMYIPKTLDDSSLAAGSFSDDPLLSPADARTSVSEHIRMAITPTPSSSGLRLPKHTSKSPKRTCSICLTTMKPGEGHAIFTAECSHSFHFHCITSNVKHGNQICPICRANWKEVPFQKSVFDLPNRRSRISHGFWPQDDAWLTVVQRLRPPHTNVNQPISPLRAPEPSIFNDDELVDCQPDVTEKSSSSNNHVSKKSAEAIQVKTYPEVSSVSRSASHSNFNILVHVKAPIFCAQQQCGEDNANLPVTHNSRAPIDLVTVLDVSGSMAGTKLALLKRAMAFVIQNLGPTDRLSVIAFSSTARRLFPLRRMTNTGRQEALQAVNMLISNGGTNIAEALKKGSKVMLDRKWKSQVSSIILLSDGQDTYAVTSPRGANCPTDYPSLLPFSLRRASGSGPQIPVHTFGFGADHDSASMHSISEASGGTYSFIEAENVIQDAFAQCIGGLLSVVVQELRVVVDCVDPSLHLSSIKAGNYKINMETDGRRTGFIEVGDLYAEEERDFLVLMDIPDDYRSNDMLLLKVKCNYKDPITKKTVTFEEAENVLIQRPKTTGELSVSIEVDRQRNRLFAAEAMAEARAAADRSDLIGAVSILEHCRKKLSETMSAQAGDKLCAALSAELREMQERMANRRIYESSGRAYVLSGLSSHSLQRANVRGDSMDSTRLMQAYQTPSMVEMINRSQTVFFGRPSPQPSAGPAQSFPAPPQPR